MKRLAPILLALQIFGFSCTEEWPRQPFSAEAWKAVPWEEHYTLCHELLDSGILVGATRERVVELLGEPNGTRKPDRISYLVRKRKIWNLIGEVKVLDIRFDTDGKVSRSFVRGT